MAEDLVRKQVQALIAGGHTTAAIAEAMELPLAAVRAVAGELTEGDRADMIGVLKAIAFDRAAPAAARARSAIYVIDEQSGRNEKNAGAIAQVAPLIEIATRLAELRTRSLPRASREPIEVSPQ